jgi:methionyl-tRNA formyltransferase
LKKIDGAIDWSRPAAAIRNQIRAFQPWPKCYTVWQPEGGRPLRLILGPIRAIDWAQPAVPGTVLEAAGDRLVIATGEQAALLTQVQPESKRAMGVQEFLLGYRVRAGERLQG